jgi:hypothetical protein
MDPTRLNDIWEMIDADDPLEWAFGNLRQVGRGDAAAVFDHPSDPDLVVRVSDYPDGWFAYADLVDRRLDGRALRHAPMATALVVRDGVWIALCERLDLISSEDSEALTWMNTAREIASRRRPAEGRLDSFRAAQPGFEELLAALPAAARDLRPSNFMMRGRSLVLNDPWAAMTPADEARMKAEYAFVEAPRPR